MDGFTLTDGNWMSDSTSYGKGKIPVLVGPYTGYNFEDTRRSMNSSKRYRWYGMTDALGNPVEPFVDVKNVRDVFVITDFEGKGEIAITEQNKEDGKDSENSGNENADPTPSPSPSASPSPSPEGE